jgi:hypothetical protein
MFMGLHWGFTIANFAPAAAPAEPPARLQPAYSSEPRPA